MRTVIRVVLVLGSIGALALGTSVPVLAQYYYPLPRDYDEPREYDAPRDYDGRPDHNMTRDYDGHRDHDGWRDHDAAQSDNGCPPGWTVQGGNCAPYQGPIGAGRRTWNGCPHGYTIQGGECKPDIGPR